MLFHTNEIQKENNTPPPKKNKMQGRKSYLICSTCILDVTKHKSDFFSFSYFTFSITCVYTCANVIPQNGCVNQRTTYGKWFSPSMSVPGIELRLGGIQLYQLSHLARPNVNFSERKKALV